LSCNKVCWIFLNHNFLASFFIFGYMLELRIEFSKIWWINNPKNSIVFPLKGKTHHLVNIYPKKMIICCIGLLSLQSHKILCKVWLQKCFYMCGISDDDIHKGANIMVAKGNINILMTWMKKKMQLLSNWVKFDFMCNGCKNIWHCIVCRYVFVIIVSSIVLP